MYVPPGEAEMRPEETPATWKSHDRSATGVVPLTAMAQVVWQEARGRVASPAVRVEGVRPVVTAAKGRQLERAATVWPMVTEEAALQGEIQSAARPRVTAERGPRPGMRSARFLAMEPQAAKPRGLSSWQGLVRRLADAGLRDGVAWPVAAGR